MRKFNPHQREQNLYWSILQIKLLIDNAIVNKSSTFISYGALECRMIIERLEYSIIIAGTGDILEDYDIEKINRFKGIQAANDKYKILKFRYQSFSEAFANAVIENKTFSFFPFKKAEDLQHKLSQYLHIYSRSDIELQFDSPFMQNGIVIIKESLNFLENINDVGSLNFRTLKNGVDDEFKKWINTKNEDIDALTARLKNIITNFSNKNYVP